MEPNDLGGRRNEAGQSTDPTRLERLEQGQIQEDRKLNWRLLAPVIGVVVAFLLGFVPMWLKAARNADELNAAQQQVKVLHLERLVAGAAIDARRGEYEPARQSASEYFTSLAEEVNNPAGNSSLKPDQQSKLQPLLKERDEIITLLARSDPAAAERLVKVYVAFRNALPSQSATPAPAPAAVATPK